jgi:DNA topoisomerase-3
MKALVLAEKPSVAREFARVLGCTQKNHGYIEGPKHVVTWALGHLVELCEPEDYDAKYSNWRMEDLPILPNKMRLKVLKGSGRQFREIANLAKRKDISELIIATDAGREGELVARWIMEMVHWKKPVKRLWISSQTHRAIKDGFAALRPGAQYDNLYRSAVCRAEADWLIGLNVTRALVCKYNAQLSAGRVQTPTLAMIVGREQEIREFQPRDYWTLEVELPGFRASWRGQGDGRLFDKAEGEKLLSQVRGKGASITEVTTKEKVEPVPLPYDLTELQRDANKRYGFSARLTADVLQRLYEQHKLVTYPRTDSRYLTRDMTATFKARLSAIALGPYAPLARPLLAGPLNAGKAVDDSKVTDHHAIIPTDEPLNLAALSGDQRRLYDLIARRFIAIFYPPCRYDRTSIKLDIGGEDFYAAGRVMKEAGWKAIYGADSTDDEDLEAKTDQRLPQLTRGQKLEVRVCRLQAGQTSPPPRLTEAALLTLMEKHNLGTPATRADIIEKLLTSDAIERKGSQLAPTAKGLQLPGLVAEELRSPDLTAVWERELEKITRGQADASKFMEGIRRQTTTLVRSVLTSTQEYKPHNVSRARCPECGQYLLEKKGKRGPALVCPDRVCGYRMNTEKQLTNKRCPQCHKKMELREGKAGKYFHCRPCNVIEKLEQEGGGKKGKQNQRQLVHKYSEKAPLTGSLADALKSALEQKE